MNTKIKPATIDQTLEQFKAQLLEEVLQELPTLTLCYSNWFWSQIKQEERSLRQGSDKAQKSAKATLEAWRRARKLFLLLSAPALREVIETVAQQIEIEFAEHRIAAADVPDTLRNTSLAEIMQHLN